MYVCNITQIYLVLFEKYLKYNAYLNRQFIVSKSALFSLVEHVSLVVGMLVCARYCFFISKNP